MPAFGYRVYNRRIGQSVRIRAFPLSNWTELDIWRYTVQEGIEVVPLYSAAEREVVRRGGQLFPHCASARRAARRALGRDDGALDGGCAAPATRLVSSQAHHGASSGQRSRASSTSQVISSRRSRSSRSPSAPKTLTLHGALLSWWSTQRRMLRPTRA